MDHAELLIPRWENISNGVFEFHGSLFHDTKHEKGHTCLSRFVQENHHVGILNSRSDQTAAHDQYSGHFVCLVTPVI